MSQSEQNMRITTIRVGAALTVPHPTVPYANVRPTIEIEAEIPEGADIVAIRNELQGWCAESVREHAASLQELIK